MPQHLLLSSRSLWAIVLAACLIGGTAQAKCRALLVVPDLVVAVEYMAKATDQNDVFVAARRIARLHQLINKNKMYQALEAEGLGSNLTDIMRLKIKLGVLSQFALVDGADKARSYLRSSDFRRSYDPVLKLALSLCAGGGTNAHSGLVRLFSLSQGKVSDVTALSSSTAADTARETGVKILKTGTYGLILFFVSVIWLNRRQLKRRRRNKRVACDIPVIIATGPHVFSKEMVDLSRTGANVECEGGLTTDDAITLEVGSHHCGATVIWSNEKYAGLKFDQTLTQSEFTSFLELSRHDVSNAIRRINEKTVPDWAPFLNLMSRVSRWLTDAFRQLRQ